MDTEGYCGGSLKLDSSLPHHVILNRPPCETELSSVGEHSSLSPLCQKKKITGLSADRDIVTSKKSNFQTPSSKNCISKYPVTARNSCGVVRRSPKFTLCATVHSLKIPYRFMLSLTRPAGVDSRIIWQWRGFSKNWRNEVVRLEHLKVHSFYHIMHQVLNTPIFIIILILIHETYKYIARCEPRRYLPSTSFEVASIVNVNPWRTIELLRLTAGNYEQCDSIISHTSVFNLVRLDIKIGPEQGKEHKSNGVILVVTRYIVPTRPSYQAAESPPRL